LVLNGKIDRTLKDIYGLNIGKGKEMLKKNSKFNLVGTINGPVNHLKMLPKKK